MISYGFASGMLLGRIVAARLLRLPAPIQDDLRGGRLTMGHARALLALTTPAEQLRLRDDARTCIETGRGCAAAPA